MPRKWVRKYKRFFALAVFFAGLAGVFFLSGFSLAGESVPVPAHKPSVESAGEQPAAVSEEKTPEKMVMVTPSRKPEVIRYSLLDFTKALLDFGNPPVPKARPFTVADGPLSEEEAAKYKQIFSYQEEGDMDGADAVMEGLKDWRLRGHILYQRYMHPAYKSDFDELKNWLALYNDYPGADKVYKLALRKNPGGESHLKKPETSKGITRTHEPMTAAAQTYHSQKKRSDAELKQVEDLKHGVLALASDGQPQEALKKLENDADAKLLDDVEYDLLQAQVAARFLYNGDTKAAFKTAAKSADRSGLHVPLAGWIAGLVSWQDGKYRRAAQYFEITARSQYASGWTSAAGSYWAARSHMRTGNVKDVSVWLRRAMEEHPRTFYGLIATRAMGHDFDFNWKVPTFTRNYLDVLSSSPQGYRAVALVAAGQQNLAEAELLGIDPAGNPDLRDALLAYAGYAGMPALALRLGSAGANDHGTYFDAALYPMGPWKPAQGYKVDPALIHAIMRQESRFDPEAESPSGARGLMQLMPQTARAVARKKGAADALDDPETNLALGQKYLETLLADKNVENDLLALLVAYNAGPGNLARWKKNWSEVKDPLMFIELIPSSETRAYVERVLANYWIYRLREGLPTPSLDAVAAGKAALYAGYNPAEYKSLQFAAGETKNLFQ